MLGTCKFLVGRLAVELARLDKILRHAPAVLVEQRKRILGTCIAALRGRFQLSQSAREFAGMQCRFTGIVVGDSHPHGRQQQ